MNKSILKKLPALLAILAMAGGVQTFTSCSSDDEGGGGGGSNCNADFGTVTIGTQIWAAKNLNCDVKGSKCYADDPANCEKYGRLYGWSTAMALPSSCDSVSCSSQIQSPHRGICPSGWHIPENAEWNVLANYAGGSSTAGAKLKATSGWDSYGDIENLDTYGFSALPGGHYYNSDGRFSGIGGNGFWWTASQNAVFSYNAYYRGMSNSSDDASWNYEDKPSLLSVRCVKD